MSNFAFLSAGFPAVAGAAASAERLAGAGEGADPTLAAVSAGRAAELAVKWAYANDDALSPPYQSTVSTLIHERAFRELCGQAVFEKLRYINKVRNRAAHEDRGVPASVAQGAVRELFHVLYWFVRSYGTEQPPSEATFDPAVFSRRADLMKAAAAHITAQREELNRAEAEIAERDREIAALREGGAAITTESVRRRKEVSRSREAATRAPDGHDYNEAETRDRFIDLLLQEAGWTDFETGETTEVRVEPMPTKQGHGFADYVLRGRDGLPLAVIEAKATKHEASQGRQQAKLYADALETMHGQRPIIFYTNGYDHWIWDDARGRPPRQLGGFYKRDELELAIQRRETAKPLCSIETDRDIAGRAYQTRALRRIAERFDAGENKALLVMATGTGKTRTVVALVDAMIRAGLVKRALFLADRKSLVRQAVGAFKEHLPDTNPVNLIEEREATGRVYVSTYPTMMGMIGASDRPKSDGERKGRTFGPGHFDLVIIDEAHRSVYRRYKTIFDYFDSYLVGLTATPREEVDRDTYELFDLPTGVPTDSYDLKTAIDEEHLVPPEPISVPTKFIREGMRYDQLDDDDKDRWDMLEWGSDEAPDEVPPSELNKFFFNQDTVDKVLAYVMANGIHVEGGDRLGKTILFARNKPHADFIAKRFDANWPDLAGRFARTITHEDSYALSLIEDFEQKDKEPHLAISVDMLDTGIDVPEVVNLVFFKPVRSKTKFWQMVGRGTRLRPDLFGPGQDKTCFRIFDFCQNLEFFNADEGIKEAATTKSLSERLFASHIALVRKIESGDVGKNGGARSRTVRWGTPPSTSEIASAIKDDLRRKVGSMTFDNLLVRGERALVEKYQSAESWRELDDDAATELEKIASLPNTMPSDTEEAKRFDLLMLNLELAVLDGSARYEKLRDEVVRIVAALEVKSSVPAIGRHAELIEDVQRRDWWEGVTVPLLELLRQRLRGVVHLIDKTKRNVLYVNFEDEIGPGTPVEMPEAAAIDEASFRKKVRSFLQDKLDNIALAKLRQGKPLTPTDIAQLETMLVEAGVGTKEDIEQAAGGLSRLDTFLRSLVGLDRAAATSAFAEFLDRERGATSNQIEFVELIIAHLTENGVMTPAMLYESPFSDKAPQGPEGLFSDAKVVKLCEVIEAIGQAPPSSGEVARA